MEASQYFTVLVLSVCAMHVAFSVSTRIQKWRRTSGVRRKPGRTLSSQVAAGSTSPQQRSDWYVFFHCADLTGDTWAGEKASSERCQQMPEQIKSPRLSSRPAVARVTLNR